MAKPTTLRGSKLLILLGDGADPEVFAAPCALATKGFNRTATTNDFNVPDCTDPDAPTWTERVKEAFSAGITGSGTLAKESVDVYEDAFNSVDPINMQVTLDYDTDPRTWEGAFHLTTFNITGEQGGLVQVELEFASHGPVAPVDLTP